MAFNLLTISIKDGRYLDGKHFNMRKRWGYKTATQERLILKVSEQEAVREEEGFKITEVDLTERSYKEK